MGTPKGTSFEIGEFHKELLKRDRVRHYNQLLHYN